jgi:putative endonuclease
MVNEPAVYLLASKRHGTLNIGVTSHLVPRIYPHRNNRSPGFSQKYQTHRLVYFELHDDMSEAIVREKQMKKWKRQWKIGLIEKGNPGWRDLWAEIAC